MVTGLTWLTLLTEAEPKEEGCDESGKDEGAEEDGGDGFAACGWGEEIGVAMGAAFGGGGDVVAAGLAVAGELRFGLAEHRSDGGEEGAGPAHDHVGKEACDGEGGGDEAEEQGASGGSAACGACEAIGGGGHGDEVRLEAAGEKHGFDGDADEDEGDDAEDLEDFEEGHGCMR